MTSKNRSQISYAAQLRGASPAAGSTIAKFQRGGAPFTGKKFEPQPVKRVKTPRAADTYRAARRNSDRLQPST